MPQKIVGKCFNKLAKEKRHSPSDAIIILTSFRSFDHLYIMGKRMLLVSKVHQKNSVIHINF